MYSNVKNKTREKISVIIPVYNVERYIGRCIESVINQTYSNIEIILVDDGSPDHCPELCDEFAQKDSRIKVIHKKNGGQSSARNAGIECAQGEYIFFLDSDDYLKENALEVLYNSLISSNTAKVAICGISFVKGFESQEIDQCTISDLEIWSESQYWTHYFSEDTYLYCIALWNKLYAREIFDELRFPEGRISEDEATAHLIMGKATQCVCLSECLYNYCQRNDSETGRKYNIRLLDSVDAYLERTEYLIEKGYYKFADESFARIVGLLYRFYIAPETMVKENYQIYKEKKTQYFHYLKHIIIKPISLKTKILATIYCLNEDLYGYLRGK